MSADFRWVKNGDDSYSGVSGGEVVARLRKIGKRWSLEHVEEGRRCTGSGCDEPCASGCDPEKNASGSPSGL